MPSASSKSASMSTQVPNMEGQDPLKVVVSMMEKKIRNLDKRKTRLVAYTQQVEEGKELIEKDQQDAVKKLELVENSLELAKEFHQIFKMMEQEHLKLQKKEQKRAKVEMKEKSSDDRHKLVCQVLEVQTLLESLDDEAKEDFLNGTNGACKLEKDDLDKLDGIYKLITPSENEDAKLIKDQVTASSCHMHNLLEEKDKPVLNTTYKEIYGIIMKIKDSKYFDKVETEEAATEEKSAEEDEAEAAEQPASAEEGETASQEDAKETEVAQATDEQQAFAAAPSEPQLMQEEATLEQPVAPLVNGVDLPVEFSEAAADSALNFMGQSEVQFAAAAAEPAEEGKLNAASPEFIPRSLQSGNSQQDAMAESNWNKNESNDFGEGSANDGGWQDVTPSGESHQHSQSRPRGGPRGRDRGGYRGPRDGRGGRGRGGYGQNNYHQRQERSDNYQRRDGGNRGRPRGGHPRGGRGDMRGAPRGNANRGGGGFGRPQQQ